MAIRIRKANEKFLVRDPENAWGFGQIVPLVLLIPVLQEFGKAQKGKFLMRPAMTPRAELINDPEYLERKAERLDAQRRAREFFNIVN